jgi:hypothetical protein
MVYCSYKEVRMFIPYGAQVKHGSFKLTPAEKAARISHQAAKLAAFAAHADLVGTTVLARITPTMTWEERLEVFKEVEAELGKVATGGEELLTGGTAPMFRQGVFARMRWA